MIEILRISKVLYPFLLTSLLFAGEPHTYIYLLPFDNIQNDPAVEWISPGLSDMTKEQIKSLYGVKVKTKTDLEVIMNDR